MNIKLLISSVYGGGAERVTCNLSNYLSKSHDVEIITMSESNEEYYLEPQVKVYNLLNDDERKNKLLDNKKRYKRLKKKMKSDEVDVYIVMLPITTILLLSLRKFTKASIVFSERGQPTEYSFFIKLLLKWFTRFSQGAVFQTDEPKNWYHHVTNSVVIPNSISLEFINNNINRTEIKKEIIGAGRLTEQKNFSLLIKSFNLIRYEYPDYVLRIFGTGKQYNELNELINNLNLEERVTLEGNTNKFIEELKNSSMYVLTSNYEGIPNTLLEAMALGVPSIATDCKGGGARLLIDNDINGFLVPTNDEAILSEKMRELLESFEKQKKFSLNSQKKVTEFLPENIYMKWENYIKKIGNKG